MPVKLIQFVGLVYVPLLIFYCYVANYSNNIYQNNYVDSIIFHVLKKFHRFYLTVWNFDMQRLFMVVAIFSHISDIAHLNENLQEWLSNVRTCLFTGVIFPCALLVHLTFWILYAIDRELIMPSCMDSFYPMWLNHCVHSLILFPLVIETLLPTKYERTKTTIAILLLLTVSILYQLMLFGVYIHHGFFLYPFLLPMNWPARIIFCQVEVAIGIMFIFLGIALQKRFKQKLME